LGGRSELAVRGTAGISLRARITLFKIISDTITACARHSEQGEAVVNTNIVRNGIVVRIEVPANNVTAVIGDLDVDGESTIVRGCNETQRS